MIIGVLVLLIGQIFGSLSYIFEEKFLSDFEDVHPYIVVGWEGLWGTIILVVMLVVFQIIPCSDPNPLCSNGVIEDSLGALRELAASST